MDDSKRICSVSNCERLTIAKGFCAAHYQRKRAGKPLNDEPIQVVKVRYVCSIPNCNRPHRAQGLCEAHYKRKRIGNPLNSPIQVRERGTCSIPNCNRPHQAQGLCKSHYERKRKGTRIDSPIRKRNVERGTCSVRGCNRLQAGKGMCNVHYLELRRTGIIAKNRPIQTKIPRTTLRNFSDLIEGMHYTVDPQTDCWLWLGKLGNGYPIANGKTLLRTLFHLTDPNIYIRHLCHTPRCCNPSHLATGTQHDNIQDMMRAGRHRTYNASKTHCLRGHPFSGENLYIGPDGKRLCRACHRERQRRRREKARMLD